MKTPVYTPLTAAPFCESDRYKEIPPQNVELAGYIRCFWGSVSPYVNRDICDARSFVTPDTCADIIYWIDHTDNTVTGIFCGINDASFLNRKDMAEGHLVSTFAVRFYGWGVYAFSEDSLKGTVNGSFEVESRFCWLDKMLRRQLLERITLSERVKAAESALNGRLWQARQNVVIDHAIAKMISQRGAMSAENLARECCISGRQLERLFHEYIGVTPKKLGNMVRYQFLWNEICRNPAFHILDAVYKYGYTDQSHLIREFKRYHTMDIQAAKQYAHNVGNIQYKFPIQ